MTPLPTATDRGRRARRTRRPRGLVPGTALALMAVLAVAGPALAPHDPSASIASAYAPAGAGLPLGADHLGRDVWSRMLSGGWPVLVLPTVAVGVSTSLGVGVGLALAATAGRGRTLVQGLDLLLVLPPLVVLLLVGFLAGPGAGPLVLAVILLSAPFTARNVRAAADPLFDAGYVEVAITTGQRRLAVAWWEILPNLWAPILADAGNRFVGAVYLVASASFLGLRLTSAATDWASMVADSLGGIRLNPAAVVAPAVAIAAVTVSANLLADRVGHRT